MKEAVSKENQITHGVIWKQLLVFFFPILLGTFFQQIYNTADTVVVGRFVGTQALAAVGGSTSQIINLIVGFFTGLASGATVVISQHYGAKDQEGVQRGLRTAYAFSIVGGVIVSILSILLTWPLLELLNTPEDIIDMSATYLCIYFAGLIFVFIYNVGAGILRAVGDSRRPLYFLIVCCFINIVLDIVLVVFFHMGVAGAAIATTFSQGVSAVLVTITLCRSTDMFKLHLRKIRFYAQPMAMILKIGLPAGLQSAMYSISNVIIQSSLNTFGTNTVAAWTAFSKIDSLYWMISGAFGIAITTFVGQNYGARKFGRMKKSINISLAMDFGSSVAISVLLLIFGGFVFRLFTTDAQVIDIGMGILRLMAPGYAAFAFVEIYSGALRGTGDVILPMLMTCGGICIFRVVWIFFILPLNNTLDMIVYSYPISWVLTGLLYIIYYFKKRQQFPDTDEPDEVQA